MAETAKKEDKFAEFPVVSTTSGAKPEDRFAEFPIVEPSFGDKAKAFVKGAVGGMTETGGMVAGTIGGAALGFAAGGPVGGAALGAIGSEIGRQTGKSLRESAFGAGQVDSMDPAVRPYGFAGEVLGGGAPIAATPLGLGAAGVRAATSAGIRPTSPTGGFGAFINTMLDMAASSPKSFAAAETAGLAGSALGSGIAESAAPGKTGIRIGAEVAGGFFNPTRLVLGTFGQAVDKAKMAIEALGKTGQENRAAAFLRKLVTESSEDPAAVAAALRSSGLPGIELTAAQKSGSPALASLESFLSKDSAKFGAERQRIGDDAMSAIKDMMVALRATGDPNALKAAAVIQGNYVKSLIAGRLTAAERDATAAAGKIATESPGARAAISKQADELLQGALKDVRSAERELWEAIPRDVKGATQNLTAKYAELKNELLPNETLPSVIEGFVRTLTKKGETGSILGADGKPIRTFAIGDEITGETTSGNLLRFRSRALELARDASANGQSGDARRYGILAEAALDDLAALPSGTQGLAEARAFSRELHDTFTRTFAGDTVATGRGGRDRIPPELTLKFALGGGREQGALQLRQIEEAMKFLPARNLGGNVELAQMVDLQNRFIRVAASESIDPLTGRVSPPKVADFMRKNEEILNRFPAVKSDLTKALSSEAALQDVQRTLTGITKTTEQQAAFAKLAGAENPVDVVRRAVNSDAPVANLADLSKVAKAGGQNAVDGLRASVWDDAIRRATDASGNVSAEALSRNIFKPLGPNQPSLFQLMQDKGIIKRSDAAKAEDLFKEYAKVEKALTGGTGIEKVGDIDPLFDMVARMAGVHAASIIAPKGPGAIVAAGRASAFARNMFENVPIAKMRDVLIQAATDPKFAAMLLDKPATKQAGVRLATQIHAYLFQAGLSALDGESQ